MEKVLIAESCASGHRMSYVKYIAARAQQRGLSPLLVCSEEIPTSQEYRAQLTDECFDDIVVVRDAAAQSSMRWVNAVIGASSRLNVKKVVVPDGDRFTALLSVYPQALRVSVTTLLMRSPFILPRHASARGRSVGALKVSLLGIAKLRPQMRVIHLAGPGYRPRRGLKTVGDPVELGTSQASWPEGTNLTASDLDRTWFGVFGNIDHRKNVPLILDSLSKSTLENWGLVLAGRVASGVLAEVEDRIRTTSTTGGLVVALNRVLTEEEFWGLLRAVDCVVVTHTTEGSSGVLLRAAVAGSRIVVAGSRSLLSHSRALGVGFEAQMNPPNLSRTLVEAVRSAKPVPVSATSPSSFADVLLE